MGDVDFGKTSNGVLTCNLTGQALDKAHSVKLRNAANQADLKTADGDVSTSGDSTKATVTFHLADLGSLGAPAYKPYPVTSDGTEESGSAEILHFSLEPFVSDPPSPDPLELTKTGAGSQPITLKGYHLDKATGLRLGTAETKPDDSLPELPVKESPSATAASFQTDQTTKLTAGKFYLFVVSKDKSDIPTGQVLNIKAAETNPVAPVPTQPKQTRKAVVPRK